ncbi:MAG: ATP-binding protein [Planctomycetota bacterium]
MQILLLTDVKDRHPWRDRLTKLHPEATVVQEDQHSYSRKHAHKAFALGVCFWDEKNTWDENSVAELESFCERVLCILNRDDLQTVQVAFDAGFDDCLDTKCSEQELGSKLNQAFRAWQVQKRLDQALKLESIGELAAGIAHEINTPIQYVSDNTRFVRSACDDMLAVLDACQKVIRAVDGNQEIGAAAEELRGSLNAADADYLVDEVPTAIAQTLEGVDRVSTIVRAMKEFSHPGQSEMALTNIAQAIETTVMIAKNEWKYVAEMETDHDEALPPIPCLPGELNQVILNLIVNAAHAIKDAKEEDSVDKGKITIATRLAAPFAEIRVTDTGVGISSENIDKIFAPFFTTKSAGKGTGQGLALAHSVVVEKHRGTLTVESELGVGTTFVIQLPLEQQETEESSVVAETV